MREPGIVCLVGLPKTIMEMMTKLEGTFKYIKTPLVLPKGSNLGLIQSLDSAANLQEIKKKKKNKGIC